MIDRETKESLILEEYESLSFEEISSRIAESKRQITELLTLPDHFAVSHENSVGNSTLLFQRAASSGDTFKLKEMLSDPEIRAQIDINAGDTPPLIYAACFGKIEVTELLLEAGANINIQDSCK
ncbi:hypothetical protein G6F56_005655 [Rhizopus delemar]|nr:hypothetical protein G6F56_005655 [Rhizopus delemar]